MSFRDSSWHRWCPETHGFVARQPSGKQDTRSPGKTPAKTTLSLGGGWQYDKAEEARLRAQEERGDSPTSERTRPSSARAGRGRGGRGAGARGKRPGSPSRAAPTSSSSFISTRIPADFPSGNSEPWLNPVVTPFTVGEHKNSPPRCPKPVFDSSGRQLNQSRWDEKTRGYVGTDAVAR